MKKFIIGHFRKCDLLTMCGTVMAFLGMYFTINSSFTTAAIMLLISGICDGFDGALARKYKYSDEQKVYGSELDSLSDVICFGVFPAFLTMFLSNHIISIIICAFYLLCGVVRLAYFNMLHITEQGKKNTFIGFPITSIAIIYPLIFVIMRLINFKLIPYVMPIVLLIMGILFIVRIELPKPNVPKIAGKILNKYTVNFLLVPILIVVSADITFKTWNFVGNPFYTLIQSIIAHPLSYIFIIILFILLANIIISLFNDSKKAKLALFIILAIFMLINDIKFIIMGSPIVPSDINYLNFDNIAMMGTATKTFGSWIFKSIFKSIVILLIGIILFKIDKIHNYKFDTTKKRISVLLTSLILLIILLLFNHDFYLKHIYQTSSEKILEYSSITEIYEEYGYFPSMYLDAITSTSHTPEGYDKDEVTTLIKEASKKEEDTVKWPQANVVFILSESFFDISKLREVTFDKNIMPNITSYKKDPNAMVFDLFVPSYGGVSVNTEFEILTSAPIAFFKAGYIPYNEYYTNVSAKNAPNIISEFNNNGYETMYLTPWGKESYQSEYVYNLFGTDVTKYNIKTGVNKGYYYSDKSFMQDIYNELKDTKKGNYKFIMSATAQNHFPYGEDKYDTYDIEIKSTSLDPESTTLIRNYAQGVYDADKELNNLYNQIKDLDTPTIIVFYGDHLPYIVSSKGEDLILSSNYINESYEVNTHTTKAVILANFDIDFDEEISIMNSSFLGSYIINHMDLEISDYFKYIENTRKVLPAFNRTQVYDQDSKTFTNLIDDNLKTSYRNYQYVIYKEFYDYGA